MIKNNTVPVAALILIFAVGYQHRQQSQNDVRNAQFVKEAAKKLQHAVPLRIDDWMGEDVPIEQRALRVAEIAGYVSRSYTHRLTGEVAQTLLVCGTPGPISAHTPDVCFAGNGYRMISEPKRLELDTPDGQPAEFWWADFQRESDGQTEMLRTFWSWKEQSRWKIANHPRIEFAASPILYKLYVATPLRGLEAPSLEEPDTEFLQALLRELEEA